MHSLLLAGLQHQASSASASMPAALSGDGRAQAPGGTAPPTLGIAWDEQSKTAALDTATRAMDLYARPTVADTVWIQDLGQLFTSQAAVDYQYVDPADIPVRKITSPGHLKVDEGNGFGCHVSKSFQSRAAWRGPRPRQRRRYTSSPGDGPAAGDGRAGRRGP